MAKAQVDLGTFEGRDVIQASIKVTRAGDGLSKSLTLDPAVFHTGDKVTVALRCEVGSVIMKPIKDTEVYERVHTFIADEAIIIDDALVQKDLTEQRRRLEEKQGIQRLDLEDDD